MAMPPNELQKACAGFYPNLTIAEAQEEALLRGMFEKMPPEERESMYYR